MSRTLTIPEDLYARLEALARSLGLESVERLLYEVGRDGVDLDQRREAVERINDLRQSIFARHGMMPDSVKLLGEDRAR